MCDSEAAVLEALGRCGLRGLSRAWVDSIWELDFTETEPLDPRVEAVITENGLEVFNNLYESLLVFASEDQENTRSLWVLFAENDICRNSLVAVLYHFIQSGESKKAGAMQRVHALHAASLYFLLLEIPGSVANQVFHPVLFDKCVNTLEKSWPQDSDSSRKRKKDTVKSSQGENRGGRKRPRPRREDPELDDLSEEDEEEVYFATRDLLSIREAIFLLLKNFLRLLPKFSLKEKPQSVLHCMQIFINLTSFESAPQDISFSTEVSVHRMKYLPELAYHGLWLLCSPMHGDVNQTLRRLFQRLLRVILMMKGGEGSNSVILVISPAVTSVKNQTIRFISFLVDELKDTAFPVLHILLQHICSKFPDKADYRLSAAQALVKLMEKLPNAEYATFIDWLYRYSKNSKISYRVFALEVAVSLLEMPEREPDESFPPENVKFLQHKFLLQVMVFSRCSDKAPTVRSKALSCLAQCLEKNATSAIEGVQELLQGSTCRTVLGMCATAESSLSSNEASSHPQKTLGTMKTIEVSEYTDALGSEGKEVLAMLRQRAADEKTNVRKSALQVLVNVLKYNLIPCSSEDLATLQDRCRDPALSVRKQALSSLTELLLAQCHNVLVQKAWLTGVVPVVLDTESSVQEKALECLDQLMLQNITHYNRYRPGDERQKLTWDLLTLLTTESQELSRYLTKAFHLWSTQDKFSSTLINNLISHTETEHSAPAWMILAKVAGSSPKLDYTKILNSWEHVSRQSDASSSTTAHILSVIGHIAKHLPAETRSRLIDPSQPLKCFSWHADLRALQNSAPSSGSRELCPDDALCSCLRPICERGPPYHIYWPCLARNLLTLLPIVVWNLHTLLPVVVWNLLTLLPVVVWNLLTLLPIVVWNLLTLLPIVVWNLLTLLPIVVWNLLTLLPIVVWNLLTLLPVVVWNLLTIAAYRGLESPYIAAYRGLESPYIAACRGLESPYIAACRGLESPYIAACRGLESPYHCCLSWFGISLHCCLSWLGISIHCCLSWFGISIHCCLSWFGISLPLLPIVVWNLLTLLPIVVWNLLTLLPVVVWNLLTLLPIVVWNLHTLLPIVVWNLHTLLPVVVWNLLTIAAYRGLESPYIAAYRGLESPYIAAYRGLECPYIAAYRGLESPYIAAYRGLESPYIAAYRGLESPYIAAYRGLESPYIAAYRGLESPYIAAYRGLESPYIAAYRGLESPYIAAYRGLESPYIAAYRGLESPYYCCLSWFGISLLLLPIVVWNVHTLLPIVVWNLLTLLPIVVWNLLTLLPIVVWNLLTIAAYRGLESPYIAAYRGLESPYIAACRGLESPYIAAYHGCIIPCIRNYLQKAMDNASPTFIHQDLDIGPHGQDDDCKTSHHLMQILTDSKESVL
ncbi:condensin-2 complex subunit D3 [Discoglossus pictus]